MFPATSAIVQGLIIIEKLYLCLLAPNQGLPVGVVGQQLRVLGEKLFSGSDPLETAREIFAVPIFELGTREPPAVDQDDVLP